jgi:hypothetical protein
VRSIDSHLIFYSISQNYLSQLLCFPKSTYESLKEHTLEENYQDLSEFDKEIFLGNLLSTNTPFPATPPPFKAKMFP